jgi:chromosome partitioning protein
MTARRISFVNFKGGVGKTSLAVNFAACLAYGLGQRVLLVDCDSQSNASIWLMGVPRWNLINDTPERSVYGIFLKNAPNVYHNVQRSVVEDQNHEKLIPTLDLLPATYRLMDLEHEYVDEKDAPYYYKFYREVSIFFDQYDYLIFDCPPNVFRASKCAIFASQELYVPCNPDVLSYVGLSLLASKVAQFQSETRPQQRTIPGYRSARIRGIVLNAVDSKANYDSVISAMRAKIQFLRSDQVVTEDADILSTYIRRSVQAGKVVGHNLPAILDKGNPALAEDYLNLCRYIHHTPLYREARAAAPAAAQGGKAKANESKRKGK